MRKNSICLILSINILFCFFTGSLFASDDRNIKPLLSEFTQDLQEPSTPISIYLAMNTQTSGEEEEDEFAEELIIEGNEEAQAAYVADPLYYFNYLMYGINDVLFYVAVKPISQGYKAIVPTPVRKGVKNFFHNLMFPVRLVNNLLQGKFSEAGTEVEIFLINSTAGVLGFGQVAQNHYDMRTSDEDLGQTFGSYNIGEGFYLFLPILGPTTLRDSVGMIGDYFITPVNYAEPWELKWGLKGTDAVNSMSFRYEDYEAIKEAAIDPYAAFKNAYIQNRNKQIEE